MDSIMASTLFQYTGAAAASLMGLYFLTQIITQVRMIVVDRSKDSKLGRQVEHELAEGLESFSHDQRKQNDKILEVVGNQTTILARLVDRAEDIRDGQEVLRAGQERIRSTLTEIKSAR